MSDHTWTREHAAAYLAGGLTLDETERLEAHVRECADCAAAVDAARHLDSALTGLFAPVRPALGLEDRAVLALRTSRRRGPLMTGRVRRATAAAAALIILGTFGALAGSIVKDGELLMPGQERRYAADSAPSAPPTLTPELGGLDDGRRDETYGARITRESQAPGVDSLDHLAEKTADDIVTADPLRETKPKSEGAAGLPDVTSTVKPTSKDEPKGPGRPAHGYYAQNGNLPPGGFGGGGFGGGLGGFGGGIAGFGGNPNTNMWSAMPPGGVQPGMGMPALGYGAAVPGTTPSPPPAGPTGTPPVAGSYFIPANAKPTAAPTPDESTKTKLTSTGDKAPEPAKGDAAPQPRQPGTDPKANGPAAPAIANPEPTRRIVIRSGDIEFEIESFDSGLAAVTKLVTGIKGAFVATVNSEKLPNGKVKGSITVRTPPEFLDGLVLDLRRELGKGGELKGVKISSQDVTKQYTDLESRLRAARAMEQRLLQIIKEGKGEIKQLLEAERELGLWRTKIEESEGELRYMSNLAALSTLTIILTEKEIRAAVGVTESERVQAGVEVEDVDKTYQQVLAAVIEAKGRVMKSELKQLSAGQYNAALNFEVAPESSGPIRDRLRQLGRVARLEIDRTQQAEGGVAPKDAKVKRGDTLFLVQLYNLANIAPRETATVQAAVPDVAAAYNTLRNAVAKASGRVQVAQLNEQDRQNVTAQLDFEVKRTEEGAVQAALAAAGEVTSRQVTRAPESDTVTDTKILYKVTLFAVARMRPRDTAVLQVAVADVSATYQTLRDAVAAAKGRVLAATIDEQDRQNVTAQLDFELGRPEEAAVRGALDAAGEVVSRQVTRAPEGEAATDAKVLYRLTLLAANRLKPRETTTLGVEVADVDQTTAAFASYVADVKGRQVDAKSARERDGRTTARLVYEVPLAAAPGVVEKFKAAGTVRAQQTVRDPQAPEGRSATARIDVTLSSAERIVPVDDGIWQPVRKGLSYSASVLLTSLTWVVFGLCVVLPWALVGYGGYRVVRWATRPAVPESPAPPPVVVTPPPPPTS